MRLSGRVEKSTATTGRGESRWASTERARAQAYRLTVPVAQGGVQQDVGGVRARPEHHATHGPVEPVVDGVLALRVRVDKTSAFGGVDDRQRAGGQARVFAHEQGTRRQRGGAGDGWSWCSSFPRATEHDWKASTARAGRAKLTKLLPPDLQPRRLSEDVA